MSSVIEQNSGPVPYSKQFYASQADESQQSAEEIVPLVMNLVRPRSVLDIGCGVGTWLKAFGHAGVTDLQGIDGDYVQSSQLRIPAATFRAHDLKRPLFLERQFDLVMSVEVAEHLPAECADQFVASLVAHGAVVLFSAAIPFQGGAHHVNEQWPDYWVERFRRHGYVVVDAVRPRIWSNQRIKYWYRQNILLFVKEEALLRFPDLQVDRDATREGQLALVHPEAYVRGVDFEQWPLSRTLSALSELIRHAARGLQGKVLRRLT